MSPNGRRNLVLTFLPALCCALNLSEVNGSGLVETLVDILAEADVEIVILLA